MGENKKRKITKIPKQEKKKIFYGYKFCFISLLQKLVSVKILSWRKQWKTRNIFFFG